MGVLPSVWKWAATRSLSSVLSQSFTFIRRCTCKSEPGLGKFSIKFKISYVWLWPVCDFARIPMLCVVVLFFVFGVFFFLKLRQLWLFWLGTCPCDVGEGHCRMSSVKWLEVEHCVCGHWGGALELYGLKATADFNLSSVLYFLNIGTWEVLWNSVMKTYTCAKQQQIFCAANLLIKSRRLSICFFFFCSSLLSIHILLTFSAYLCMRI